MWFRTPLCLLFLAATAFSIEQRQSDADYEWSLERVIGAPAKLQAGNETVLRFNFSAATPPSTFNEDGYRKVRVYLARYVNENRTLSQAWCFLEPCVLPNVTSIRTTIPAQSFPDEAQMILRTGAFDSPSQDDPKQDNYTGFIADSLPFELEGGNATFSEFEKEHGWRIVFQGFQVPCDKVPCARTCVEKHLSLEHGNSVERQPNMGDFENCATDCGLKSRTDPEGFAGECISENDERSTSGGGGSGGSSGNSGSSSGDDSKTGETGGGGSDGSNQEKSDDTHEEDDAVMVRSLSSVLLVGGLAIGAGLVL